MKITLSTIALTLALAVPAFAQTAAEELFAMDNNSAAETIVSETSTGDIEATELKIALGNMSAAERKVFFEADHSSRMEILMAMRDLGGSDSPAEMQADK